MELNDQLIGFIAIVSAVAGLGLLFLGLQGATYTETRIAALSDALVGKKIAVNAVVGWSKPAGNALLLSLDDGAELKAVLFRPKPDDLLLLQRRNPVKAKGVLQSYRGELELVIERVEALD